MNKQDVLKERGGLSLIPKVVFGIRTDILSNVQFFSIDKVAFVSGNYIVISNVKGEAHQFFVPLHNEYKEITSFGIDEYKDTIMLATAQKAEKMVILLRFINKHDFQIEDWRTRRLSIEDIEQGDYFVSLAVNVQKGYVIGLTGPKANNIAIFQHDWKTNQTKVHSVVKLLNPTLYKFLSINPHNPVFFSVIGEGGLCICNINEQDKTKLTKIEIEPRSPGYQEFSNFLFNFIGGVWVNKTRYAFVNTSSDLFVIDYIKRLDAPYKKVVKSTQIFDIQVKVKGIFSKNGNIFIVRDDGVIQKMDDRSTDKVINYEKYPAPKYIQNLPRMEVHCISLNNNFGYNSNWSAIVISTVNSQLYYVDLNNDNNIYDGINFKYLSTQFHSEEITGIDVAKIKPLIATCSRDRSIKIWNYISNQLENSEIFEEEPLQLAFHPTGLHLVVLFRDKFKLMHVCEKSILVYREYTLFQPRDVKFSNYGNFFSVCFKNTFQIYNFYTLEPLFIHKVESHTGNVTSLVWDQDDIGFVTCGLDGKTFYWQVNYRENFVFEYSNKDMRFIDVAIYNDDDSKKIVMLDENVLLEYTESKEMATYSKLKEEAFITNKNDPKKEKLKYLMKNSNFTKVLYDKDTKVLVASSSNEHSPCILLKKYPGSGDLNEYSEFQANCLGVTGIRTSFDMTHLITVGRDKSIFIFHINGISKSDKKEDILESDLILVEKEQLDNDHRKLKQKLDKINADIQKEQENFNQLKDDFEKEIETNERILFENKEKFASEKFEKEEKIKYEIISFENEIQRLKDEHSMRMLDLMKDQEKTLTAKEEDKKRENENFEKQKNIDDNTIIKLKRTLNQEINKLKANYENQISNINIEIKKLNEQKDQLKLETNLVKEEHFDNNDVNFSIKRSELEKLKIEYDNINSKFNESKSNLESEIMKKKDLIKTKENLKLKERGELLSHQQDNEKLTKQIQELLNDRREKEQTIIEKNMIRRELEQENQELEKFKFVLNYKIKELKHEKDPKENKKQNLEKQAKDMDREIKNFEFAQARYIIKLSTNHEIMNLYERRIRETEKRIEKLKNYKKLFQESLYNAMKNSKNHKELKKELVNLKRNFLDIEFIDTVERPYESNHESQRQFLENNINDYKQKIETTQRLFSQEHKKLMFENRKLITIMNDLEIEKNEIDEAYESFKNINKQSNFKSKPNNKPFLPIFNKPTSSLEHRAVELEKQIFEVEKEIQLCVNKKKKEKEKDKKK